VDDGASDGKATYTTAAIVFGVTTPTGPIDVRAGEALTYTKCRNGRRRGAAERVLADRGCRQDRRECPPEQLTAEQADRTLTDVARMKAVLGCRGCVPRRWSVRGRGTIEG
jgi:hypothetical protein